MSERVPLGDVPSLELPVNGNPVLLGRSSNSSQYQLSANRLISRVHVRAVYQSPDRENESGQVVIECMGWNGLRVLCRGQAHELGKGDTFSSGKPHVEIIVDVQDTRVLIRWPALVRKGSTSAFSDVTFDEQDSPSRRTPRVDHFPSSPPLMAAHLHSPVSPSPRMPDLTASRTFLGLPSIQSPSPPHVQVYEDHESADEAAKPEAIEPEKPSDPTISKDSIASSSLSSADDNSDREEENDPIIQSFGPFGANLLPRMASFRAVSPDRRRAPLRNSISPRQPQKKHPYTGSPVTHSISEEATELSPIRNHVINQLAFSRLHSLPLSTIMNSLPSSLKSTNNPQVSSDEPLENDATSPGLTDAALKQLLDDTACVGEIVREGKDAAGKPLEDEFYYVPEMDADEGRKAAFEGNLGKPGLRAVRKQHKVCNVFSP